MYPNLFGIPALRMYDLIGMLGYVIVIVFFLLKKNRSTWGKTLLLMAVHLVAYTFAGQRLAALLPGRATEFFGYLGIAGAATALAAVAFGENPLRQLDRTVPLHLILAAVLKLGCFCSGCCQGYPWVYGLFNHQTGQAEFPVQLLEGALYALLLWALWRYKGRPGQRFALMVMGYAAGRFLVQFARVDQPVFSGFHWLSGAFFALGAALLVLIYALPAKKEE